MERVKERIRSWPSIPRGSFARVDKVDAHPSPVLWANGAEESMPPLQSILFPMGDKKKIRGLEGSILLWLDKMPTGSEGESSMDKTLVVYA